MKNYWLDLEAKKNRSTDTHNRSFSFDADDLSGEIPMEYFYPYGYYASPEYDDDEDDRSASMKNF